MIRRLGFLMGSLFLLGGVLGFVPGVVNDGMYFGIFMVNTPHSLLHIASGTIFLIAAAAGRRAARLWFQMFGVLYAVMALVGLKVGAGMICGVISNNYYDAWGHAALALGMLAIGFGFPGRTAECTGDICKCKSAQPVGE